jgi:hypothetical protein
MEELTWLGAGKGLQVCERTKYAIPEALCQWILHWSEKRQNYVFLIIILQKWV